jgi:glycosyltransferase involved in cell wall biosynthesis
MLSVLHISTYDNIGGSGRSAYRIHQGLKRMGVRSRMLVGMKTTTDADVSLFASRPLRMADYGFGKVMDRLSLQYLFYPSSFLLPRHRWFRECDVVQIYNTHGGYFSHTALPLIARRRPVVWRLSDMWPMTGHCAYSFDCEGWKTGCGSCPIVSHYPALRRDTTAALWRMKRRVYSHTPLTIVAPSRWIAELSRQSPLLGSYPVHIIPNGLDTEVFRPLAKETARERLGIDKDRRVILFSADSIKDQRKGAAFMQQAIERLAADNIPNVTLLLVGAHPEGWDAQLPFNIKQVDHVDDDAVMATVYSAADIFVLPTLADNLPNGVLESMACATPPLTFDVGGCGDAVRHMETGYLAAYRNVDDLARGLRLLLSDATLRARLGHRGREVAVAEYSEGLQTERFMRLYEEVVEQHRLRAPASVRARQSVA